MSLDPGRLVLSIYPPDDPAGTPLGTLTHAKDKTVNVQRGEPGGGSFTMSTLSEQTAWCTPGAYVLVYRNEVTTPDEALAGFFIEQPTAVLLSPNEQGGKLATYGGRGPIACLEEPIMWHRQYRSGVGTVRRRRGNWLFRARSGELQIARVLLHMIREAKARGAIPFVEVDFGPSVDSEGTAWPDDTAVRRYVVPIGPTLTELVTMLRTKGIEIDMTPDFVLHTYPEDRVVDLSGVIAIVEGETIAGEVVRQIGATRKRSHALVGGERRRGRGERFVAVARSDFLEQLGRRKEGFRDVGRTATRKALRRVGRRSLRRWNRRHDGASSVPVLDAEGQIALRDYTVGDTVLLDIPGTYSSGQVVEGIHLVETANGEYNVVLEFAGLMPDRGSGEDFSDDAATVVRGAL